MTQQEQLLKDYIQSIENINEAKSVLFAELKAVFEEAETKGLNIKALKEIIKLRKLNKDEYVRQESMVDQYKRILGMVL